MLKEEREESDYVIRSKRYVGKAVVEEIVPTIIQINNNLWEDRNRFFSIVPEKYIDARIVCHTLRLLSDIDKYKKFNTNLITPYSSFSKNVKSRIKFKNVFINIRILRVVYQEAHV